MRLSLFPVLLAAAAAAAPVAHGIGMDDRKELFYTEEEEDEDADLFADSSDGPKATRAVPRRAVLIAPVGFAVAPVVSAGIGVDYAFRPGWSLRIRYERGAASIGDIDVVTESVPLDVTFTPWRPFFVNAGPVYRHVRARPKDDVPAPDGDVNAARTVLGIGLGFGVQKSLGNFLIGFDAAGLVVPATTLRERGPSIASLDEEDEHVGDLSDAAGGRSYSFLRLYFGPRF